ncbi:MAG: type IV secretory system conjugative DNA transfer family protein [Desulfovibrionaceae bacterium]
MSDVFTELLRLVIAAACVAGAADLALSLVGVRANLTGRLLGLLGRFAGQAGAGLARGAWSAGKWLLFGMAPDDGYMTPREIKREYSPANTGLVLSDKYRLSEPASMMHVLVLGGSGSGKTSGFLAPNLAQLPGACPVIVNDPKGSLLERYAPVLAVSHRISCLNMVDPENSCHFNPVSACRSPEQLDSLVATLLAADQELFWKHNAASMVRGLATALLDHPDEKYHNLTNLSFLIDSLQRGRSDKPVGESLMVFMRTHLKSKHPRQFQKFMAQFGSSEKMVQGWASTANAALDPLISPDLQKVSCTNDLPLDRLRDEPHAIFLTIPPAKSRRCFAFMSLFYAHLFDRLLSRLPEPGDHPVYLLLDEFPAMHLPDFAEIIAQAREFRLSLTLICQSLSQLSKRYGSDDAKVIMENCGTRILLPGLEHSVAKQFAEALGRIETKDPKTGVTERRDVASPQEISRLRDQALVFSTNKKPALIPFVKIHDNRRLRGLRGAPGFQMDWPPGRETPLIDLSGYRLNRGNSAGA